MHAWDERLIVERLSFEQLLAEVWSTSLWFSSLTDMMPPAQAGPPNAVR